MSEVSKVDRQAVERLTTFFLKEALVCSLDAVAKSDPLAARSLLKGIEQNVLRSVSNISTNRSEGSQSQQIAMAVGTYVADALDQARETVAAYGAVLALHDAAATA